MTSVDTIPRDQLKATLGAPGAPKQRSAKRKVTGGLATACLAMIHEGLPLDQAAKRGNLQTRMLRIALTKPHVISWLREQRDVFREEVRASNIHRARQIRDKADNMPAMHAIRFIEGETESNQRVSGPTLPGFVIVLHPGEAPAIKTIEHDQLGQYAGKTEDQ